jgi:hypothetical protein
MAAGLGKACTITGVEKELRRLYVCGLFPFSEIGLEIHQSILGGARWGCASNKGNIYIVGGLMQTFAKEKLCALIQRMRIYIADSTNV